MNTTCSKISFRACRHGQNGPRSGRTGHSTLTLSNASSGLHTSATVTNRADIKQTNVQAVSQRPQTHYYAHPLIQTPTKIFGDQQRASVTDAKKSLLDHRRIEVELLELIAFGIAHIHVIFILSNHSVAPAQETCMRA